VIVGIESAVGLVVDRDHLPDARLERTDAGIAEKALGAHWESRGALEGADGLLAELLHALRGGGLGELVLGDLCEAEMDD